jgi:hypothetical protein
MADPKASDVRVIIETDLEDADINKMVGIAKVFFGANLGDQSIDGSLQFEILRQMAAHFVWVRDAETRVKLVSLAGAIREDYLQPSDLSLKASPFWQMAVSLDPSGILGTLDMPIAEFQIFGPSRTTDEESLG